MKEEVIIIGAGPGGLTAAYWLETRFGIKSNIHELQSVVGGISQTVNREGWRFDIGGHRFFTKVETVENLWHEILPKEDFLLRPRLSRIYYKSKFFDYPLKPLNALFGLGLFESIACICSYFYVRLKKPSKESQENFEGWVAARFGWRLYRTFFKTYTEKVWGIPAHTIQADWAAQRIKNLNLVKAVLNAFSSKKTDVTSLIEEFEYPKFGPGQMWEVCAKKLIGTGSKLTYNSRAIEVKSTAERELIVTFSDGSIEKSRSLVSTMPINQLVEIISEPRAPQHVLEAAKKLKHRDFLTVALVVPREYGFPDNWIYIHSPEVKLGRIQNFLSWSPFMVPESDKTCLGLEYFVNVGDELWNMEDSKLIEFASNELSKIKIVPAGSVIKGYVVRVPKAYPVYDGDYSESLDIIREWLSKNLPNIYPVGRNGMHRYNNQDLES
jgi:protoporphyrinogen oxidase